MGYLVVCIPPPPATFAYFWFQAFHFVQAFPFNLHLFCAQTPCICGYICLFKASPQITKQRITREEREKTAKRTQKMGSKQ